jgi:hypothetical protein
LFCFMCDWAINLEWRQSASSATASRPRPVGQSASRPVLKRSHASAGLETVKFLQIHTKENEPLTRGSAHLGFFLERRHSCRHRGPSAIRKEADKNVGAPKNDGAPKKFRMRTQVHRRASLFCGRSRVPPAGFNPNSQRNRFPGTSRDGPKIKLKLTIK